MNKPETRLRNAILKRLRTEWPGYWVHVHGNAYTPAGIPDILGCWKGRFVGFEIKTPGGGDATNLQEYNLKQITQSGGVASVIHSYDEANAILVEVVRARRAAREQRSGS
jgi:hypothetical protein